MKKTVFLFIALFLTSTIIAQNTYEAGYIVTQDDEIITGKIFIPNLKNSDIRFIQNGQTIKYSRRKMKDYGYIIDGEKQSKYASTAFASPTQQGFYVNANSNDTIYGYFKLYSWESFQLVGYYQDTKTKMYVDIIDVKSLSLYTLPTDIDTYNQIRFRFKKGIFNRTIGDIQLCKPYIEGEVVLYKTIRFISHGTRDVHSMHASGEDIPVYVFIKDGETYTIQYSPRKKNAEIIEELKAIFPEYEPIQNLSVDTFSKQDIPDIVRKYNEQFEE